MEPVETQSESGATTIVWQEKTKLWSTFEPMNASEKFAEQHIQDEFRVKFRTLYRNDITAKMRVEYQGRVFDIVQHPMDYLGLNKELHIVGRERGED